MIVGVLSLSFLISSDFSTASFYLLFPRSFSLLLFLPFFFVFLSLQGGNKGSYFFINKKRKRKNAKRTEFVFMKENTVDILPKRTHSENRLVHLSSMWKIYIS